MQSPAFLNRCESGGPEHGSAAFWRNGFQQRPAECQQVRRLGDPVALGGAFRGPDLLSHTAPSISTEDT